MSDKCQQCQREGVVWSGPVGGWTEDEIRVMELYGFCQKNDPHIRCVGK